MRKAQQGELNVDTDLAGFTETGIEGLQGDLQTREAEVAAELQSSMHGQYTCFLAASQVCLRRLADHWHAAPADGWLSQEPHCIEHAVCKAALRAWL